MIEKYMGNECFVFVCTAHATVNMVKNFKFKNFEMPLICVSLSLHNL